MPDIKGSFPLKGAIDIHSEASSVEFLRLACAEQLRAVVLKWPGGADSAPAAVFANNSGNGVTKFFGGVCLDRAVGGMNPAAVECSASAGGMFAWMPTVDAIHHRRINHLSEEGAVHVLDSKGRVLPEAKEVLKAVAERGLVLGTGHLSAPEVEALVETAVEVGVKRVVLNHPLLLGFDVECLRRITGLSGGVFIEHCYVPDHPKPFDVGLITAAIESIGAEQSLIADFGMYGKDSNIADALVAYGMPLEQVRHLAINRPATVLGLVANG
jgi:hypothetical protein